MVMSPSALPYQTLRQMEGREHTSVLAAEGGWMEFCCLGYCCAEDPSWVAELRQGASHLDTGIPMTSLELRAEVCYQENGSWVHVI